jgi:hypothetical protein
VGIGGREEESMKRVVDRLLDLKHAWMGESLQRLCPEEQSQERFFPCARGVLLYYRALEAKRTTF